MATDNDNVIDIDGSKPKEGERKPEGKEGGGGKEGADGGKKAKQKKVALMVALGVFGLIAAYLAYTYYKNNIAGGGAASDTAPADDDGSGSGAGGGAPAVTPTPAPTDTGGQAPVVNIILPNGAPSAVAKVKTAAHKVTGHASGPKITTPKTFVKAAQKVVKLASGAKVQKAVATPANLDVTKAIGAEAKDTQTANNEAEANAHGHTANPIVHAVAVPTNLDVTKALGDEEKKAAAAAPKPKAAPSLSKAPAFSKAPAPKAPAVVHRTVPAPVNHAVKRPA